MLRTRSTLVPLFLLGLGWPLLRPNPAPATPPGGQDPAPAPAPQGPPPTPPPGDGQGGVVGFLAEQRRALQTGIVGHWSLERFDHVSNPLTAVPIFGQLHIAADGYLHLIVHTREPDAGLFEDDLRVQAGVHHWRLTDSGVLQTSSILSHSNFSGSLEVEYAFLPREYRPTLWLDGQELRLERPDGSVFRWKRLAAGVFPAITEERIRDARLQRFAFEVPR
jgi:hypothetical protein